MPWLSPSIKLIETFLESKRNEPLPSLLPSPIFLSVPLSFYIPPIYIYPPLPLSVSSFHPSTHLSLSLSSVSGSTFSFAFTPPFTLSIAPPPLLSRFSFPFFPPTTSFYPDVQFDRLCSLASSFFLLLGRTPPRNSNPRTASLMSMLLSRHSATPECYFSQFG